MCILLVIIGVAPTIGNDYFDAAPEILITTVDMTKLRMPM